MSIIPISKATQQRRILMTGDATSPLPIFQTAPTFE